MVLVTGHRGAAGLEPENTLRSFQRALDLRVDAVELDVHLTKDKHLVVIHDSTVDRTTDDSGAVIDLSLPEIQQLDAGQGEHVPTLQEVIDLVAQKAILGKKEKEATIWPPHLSGRRDLNPGPLQPHCSALAKLRHAPL